MSIERGRFRVTTSVVAGAALQGGPQVSLSATTATKVVASTPDTLANVAVTVQAPKTNTASIWIGGSSAVTNTNGGIELQAGQSATFEVADPSTIYAYAVASGQKVNVVWV